MIREKQSKMEKKTRRRVRMQQQTELAQKTESREYSMTRPCVPDTRAFYFYLFCNIKTLHTA